MTATLIYDAASMSRTPQQVLALTVLLALAAAGVWAWNRWHGRPAGGLSLFFAGATLLFSAVTAAAEYEKRWIGQSKDIQVVEGPLHRLWEDRTLRAGSQRDHWQWQGFRIGETPFVYCRNTDTNYFNNAGEHQLTLHEGLRLRVHYLEQGSGDELRRHIVRLERLEPAP